MSAAVPTLVTAIFGLGRETLEPPFARVADHYRRHAPAVLGIDLPMVVYTDAAHESFVRELRGDRPTRIHVVDPMQLAEQELYAPVHRVRTDPAWRAQAPWLAASPQAALRAYNPVVLTKPLWLYQQALANPFGTSHLYWIDGGLGHTVDAALLQAASFQRLAQRHDRFLLLCYPYDPDREVHGFDAAALAALSGVERTRWVARGGFFGGPVAAVSEIAGLYSQHLEHTLAEGLMGTEESLLTLLSYREAQRFDLQFVGRDGLVAPFFEQLAQGWPGDAPAADVLLAELAETWFVSYNAPLQFQRLLESIAAADPALLQTARRVLVNNSTDASAFADYDAVCAEWGIEQLRDGNRGINGARIHAADLFERGGRHAMAWFEDDMLLVAADDPSQACENGLPRHVHQVGGTALAILQREFADWVKFSFTEVFTSHHTQWAFNNLSEETRAHYFPGVTEAPPLVVSAIQSLDHAPYAVGEVYYSNWPHVVTRRGSRKLFAEERREPCYEQYWAARSFEMLRMGQARAAVLLASPVHHHRTQDYARVERIEYQRVGEGLTPPPEPVRAPTVVAARPAWPLQPGAIFVSIANYRDSETPHTLRSLFANATHPERVFAGVLSQVVPGDDDDCLPAGAPEGHLREIRVHASESLGACWARSRILEELLQGEEYVLQVDSHMRFEPGWDTRLLASLRRCPSPQALLTTYPPGYRPPDELGPRVVTVLAADLFNDMGILMVQGRGVEGAVTAPVPSAFLSANCLFGPAQAFREVPYDPWLYFHGEEISLAVRFWTHGWNLYAPDDPVLYHDYTTDRGRPRNWHDRQDWVALNIRSFARLRHMLGVEASRDPVVLRELHRYGLGAARSLAEYEEFADVAFAQAHIGPRAADGHFPEPASIATLEALRIARADYLESRSGPESTLVATEALRPALEVWLRETGVRSLADLGCGDFHWMQAMDLSGLDLYMGYDIVPELVARNQALHGARRGHFFTVADIACTPLARCDAVLCRNVLDGMPVAQAARTIDNIRRSGARWLLATTASSPDDAATLDLRAAPFHLPAPLQVLEDGVDFLGIWSLEPGDRGGR